MTSSTATRRTEWAVAVAALIALPMLYAITLLDGRVVDWLIEEEHPVELAGFVGLLSSSVLCILLWRANRTWAPLARCALVALAVIFFFGAGEEISWGQRILGFGTPEELAKVNVQDETTVHNLAFFSGGLNFDFLFQLFWLFMGVVIPLAALWAPLGRRLQRLVPILPAPLAAGFVLNQLLIRVTADVFDSNPELYRAQRYMYEHTIFEIKETAVSLLFAAAFFLLYRARGSRRDLQPIRRESASR